MLNQPREAPAFVLENRLELHPLTMQFDRPLFELIQSYRPWLRRWQNWPDHIHALGHMRRLIHHSIQKARQNNGFDWALVCAGRPAGKIGMLYIDWQLRETEIGYWLAPPFQGSGHMTRSCRQIVAFAFDELRLRKIRIRCAEHNWPSRAIPERLGFSNQGRLPFPVTIHSQPQFEVLYSLEYDDWVQRQ